MAISNRIGKVKILRIGQSNAAKFPNKEKRSTTIMATHLRWYSLLPSKYSESWGIKDIGSNFWNQGRTEEIRDRYVHLGTPQELKLD